MNVIAKLDKLLDEAAAQERGAGTYMSGLAEARKLILAFVKQRQAMDIECSRLIHRLNEENHALRKEQDEARHDLARAVGLVVPGHHTFEKLLTQLIEQRDEARRELEQHECEEEEVCENCRWGYNDDECDDCDETAATVKRAIEILEELT